MIVIRACAGFEELEACVQLQIETWGIRRERRGSRARHFWWRRRSAARCIGAFDTEISGGTSCGRAGVAGGFCLFFAWSEDRQGRTAGLFALPHAGGQGGVQESRPGRATQAGAALEALSRGIRHIEWTFDPLEIKNAFLNIHKLGAVARGYLVNFYGVSSSRLQGGLADGPPVGRVAARIRPGFRPFWRAARQPRGSSRKKSRNAFRFRPPSISGRPRKPAANEPWPFSWRTGASFSRHFPRDWPYLASSGMRKEMESSNWVPLLKRSWTRFPKENKNL